MKSTELRRFFRDANRFVTVSHEAIVHSAPHTYLSALVSSAKDSLVYQQFTPLCTGLVSVEIFGTIRHGGSLVMTLVGHTGNVNSVAYSQDGRHLASGSDDCTVRLWDTRTGEETLSLLCGNDVESVAFSSDGTRLAAGTDDAVVHVWDVATGRAAFQPPVGHTGRVWSVAFSPDGALIATGSWDKTIRLWRADTGAAVYKLGGHTGHVNAIAFSPDSRLLASGSDDSTVRLWNVATPQPIGMLLGGHESLVSSVAFSPTGSLLASASYDATVCLWDINTRALARTLQLVGDVLSVSFSPDGRNVVTGDARGGVRIWDLQAETSNQPVVLRGHSNSVRSVSYSPDGLYVASASDDDTIRIWDPRSRHLAIQPLSAHNDRVLSVAVSPDGASVISGSWDCSIRVWNVRTGEPSGVMDSCLLPATGTDVFTSGRRTRGCQWANRYRQTATMFGQSHSRPTEHGSSPVDMTTSFTSGICPPASWSSLSRVTKTQSDPLRTQTMGS